MVTLEELNQLRQNEKWKEVLDKSREHLKLEPAASFALRAQVQALERLNQKDEEYEGALFKLLEQKDRVAETAQKLAHYYLDQGEREEAARHLEIALEDAAIERQYDVLESLWLEMSEMEPRNVDLYLRIANHLAEIKQHHRAATLLQLLLPTFLSRKDWSGRYLLLKRILELNPKEKSLREPLVETLKNLHPVPHMDRVLDYTGIRTDKPLPEAMDEVELFMNFLPGSYLRHPDWGIGKVKDLDMSDHRVLINFQRKRDHWMNVELAKKAVEPLAENDFRVQRVINHDGLVKCMRENPIEFVKSMLKSCGGSLTAKEFKDYLVPDVINVREWTTWWSNVNSAMRRDPYIAVCGGSAKKYTLREQAASDEDEFLKRFDETKAPHSKVDLIADYLRTTKRADMHEHVIRHFSKKLHALAPRRRSPVERVELWFANEGLKDYLDGIESLPQELIDETLGQPGKVIEILQHLRFKAHQSRYAQRYRETHPHDWPDLFQKLLLEPNVMDRDELANALQEAGMIDRITTVVDQTAGEFRQYPHTFIWLAECVLAHKETWFDEKVAKSAIIERLLLLVDYLTSQAKRREREEAVWLRKVAGDARELIRRDRYSLFKEYIKDADENGAQSIYRRAQTNEGLDSRTSADLTTIVRARFPELFASSTREDTSISQGLLCLKETYERKQALFKRIVTQDMPEVVLEIETARKHGDLKENAEYHAARDKQKLLSSQAAELEEALHGAKSIDPATAQCDRIEFGVVFRISPKESDLVEEYIMLGPWESDPDRRVLSYQAPFAFSFLGKTIGDLVEVDLPTHTGRYQVVAIEPIPADRLKKIVEEEVHHESLPNLEEVSELSESAAPTV